MKQYDTFVLIKDLNSNITKGFEGVILEVYDSNTIEVEFVKEDGTNHEYNGMYTFQIDSALIEIKE